MSNGKNKKMSRAIAAILSVVMIFSILPLMPAVQAATEKHPDMVTIAVVDEYGKPVENAQVSITVDSVKNGKDYVKKTEQTDKDGVVEVIEKEKVTENDLTLTARANKEGYVGEHAIIENKPIALETDHFNIELPSFVIESSENLEYTGEPQKLVCVKDWNGKEITKGVSYRINDGEEIEKAEAIDAGSYDVEVIVRKKGYEEWIKKLTVTIDKKMPEISLKEKELFYDEKLDEQELVTLEGSYQIKSEDQVIWIVNGQETGSEQIPTASAVGNYEVSLQVIPNDKNYKKFESNVTSKINLGKLDLTGLTVKGLEGVYNKKEQEAVEVNIKDEYEYELKYQLDDGDQIPQENAWEKEIPKVLNAGSYIVWVRAVKENYNDSNVDVEGAPSASAPYNVYVAKANQSLQFKNDAYKDGDITEVTLASNEFPMTYDFKAIDEKKEAGGTITYSIALSEEEENAEDITEVATIDAATGELTVVGAGAVIVKATLSGNNNYKECVITHQLNISMEVSEQGEFIKFEKDGQIVSEVPYVLGTNGGVASDLQAKKIKKWDKGKITYSVDGDEKKYGLTCNEKNGKITVSDYEKISQEIQKNQGILTVKVVAHKSKTLFYPADSASYLLKICFMDTPEEAYSISSPDGNNGWYKTAPTVTPKEGYQITNNLSQTFESKVSFTDQGSATRYVYLKDIETGGITDRIPIQIKIDTKAPDAEKMYIEITDLDIVKKNGKDYGFFNPSVTMKFVVEDEDGKDESGVSDIRWYYEKESGVSDSILLSKEGGLSAKKEDGKYVATMTLIGEQAEQYRGHISFIATDKAGNLSDKKRNDTVVVVDTINPTMKAEHSLTQGGGIYNKVDNQHYYNGDVTFKFIIEEANFFSEDVKAMVTNNREENAVVPKWDSDKDTHTGTVALTGDGDYTVRMQYKDQSQNGMKDESGAELEEFISEVITIDETKPELDFRFEREKQKTIFTVKEHNFRPQDITVTGTIKDINGNDLDFTPEQLTDILRKADWNKDGDVYTYETDQYVSGIYDLTVNYKDIAGNEAAPLHADSFIIDHEKPFDAGITYSKSILDTVLEKITLGFYKPDVTVTFTAYDTSSGVDTFQWSYTQQDGTSSVNRPTDTTEKIDSQVVEAIQDAEDKSKFTATITLTATDAEQIRGYLSVAATDKYDNRSDKITDEGYVLVVDTISPTMNVEYSKEARKVGERAYYNGNVEVTFVVNEANFFAEDVKVTVSKDGGTPYAIKPTWKDENADTHMGTYTLSGDGDYIIYVEYTDRSTNEMETYTSHMITIDTIAPTIEVQYQDKTPINTLEDRDGNKRKYFSDTQTAVLKITEHNFSAEEVEFSISAKDVTGKQLSVEELHKKTTWSTDDTGDVHTIMLTYPGDANYIFDVAYTDLATNAAKDYTPDYFTVDKTAPVSLTVDYSTSVLDTILESVSFGFYNAKMRVTLTAEDVTSGVHSFLYSYMNAAGVSSVNAELINQAIQESDIEYSENGKNATIVFEIPKMVLGNDNQFNGTVGFTVEDRAGRKTEHQETKRIVVDNISPTAEVSFNKPVNIEDDISYYNGNINTTVIVREANFYAEDVEVMVSKDGGAVTNIRPSWSDSSVDVHTGTFTLSEDGDYVITIRYRDKSSNEMETYISRQLTIDTSIENPVIMVNGKNETGKAYKEEVVPSVSFEDENFATYEIVLTRTRFDEKNLDVTKEIIGNHVAVDEKGGSGSFDEFEKKAENDGIYNMTVKMTDKAGHSSETTTVFTVNRFGSVYEYGDYLISLIKNGGTYVDEVKEDLVITEYNADRLLAGTLNIEVTCDGKPLDKVNYKISPVINDQVSVGDSGWFQYEYVIDKKNFDSDGIYKIAVSSKDATGNTPENSNYKDKNILFRVDSTAPEITSVVGLEEDIINAQEVEVKYTVFDAIALKSVKVFVDDKQVGESVKEFDEDLNNYEGSFVIDESSSAQEVRIVVEDLAGNITDTNSKNFSSVYAFNNSVTVSTNFFVRWYADKALFWGTIGGFVVIAGGLSLLVIMRKRKKEEN